VAFFVFHSIFWIFTIPSRLALWYNHMKTNNFVKERGEFHEKDWYHPTHLHDAAISIAADSVRTRTERQKGDQCDI
jgi:hypothetical protein